MMAKQSGAHATLKTWLVRATIVIVVGLAIGATGGVVAVRTSEPGRANQPDSLRVMLDSIAKGTPTTKDSDARTARRATDSSAAAEREQRFVDSVENAKLPATVPDVIGLEEGVARTRIAEARLLVGVVQLEDSRTAAGTVIRTQPAAGEALKANASVDFVLSNGRIPPDNAAHFASQPVAAPAGAFTFLPSSSP